MQFDPKNATTKDIYNLMISAIVPRPIAFISTQSEQGITNVAPFSYFNGVSSKPPLISVSISHRRWQGKLIKKDTLRNIEETKEFVVNIVNDELLTVMNASATEYPPDMSEIDALQIETEPSLHIKPPRVKKSPVQLECKLERVIMLGDPALNGLVIGEVVCFHINDSVWDTRSATIDPEKLRPIARLGGNLYASLTQIVSLPRPEYIPGS
jgi:flavin reductase (DIM6/NTAB) family NADH-FMN oxidoreductase RutF